MNFINKLFCLVALLVFLSHASGHMSLVTPAPRRSKYLSNYSGPVDYDMDSPLGGRFTFPCRGYPSGTISAKYKAGESIQAKIGGGAMHNGGHCQFSISYDGKNFAVLKTVMGNCLTGGLNYDIPIPKDAPNGKATFAWSWINRTGNREYYMNCADIEIEGGNSQGKITGPKMLVANLPGYVTFPEGFKDDYGKEIFEAQQTITIKPNGQEIPKPTTTSITQVPTQTTTLSPKPTHTSTNAPTSTTTNSPSPTSIPQDPSQCVDGRMYCVNQSMIAMCFGKVLYKNPCATGTRCQNSNEGAQCI